MADDSIEQLITRRARRFGLYRAAAEKARLDLHEIVKLGYRKGLRPREIWRAVCAADGGDQIWSYEYIRRIGVGITPDRKT